MTADYRIYCEGRLAVTLAGDLAMRRALQGSAPGWRRLRSGKELTAFHEAGHAVVAEAIGFHVHRVFIVPAVTGSSVFGGACTSTFDPKCLHESKGEPALDRSLPSDRQTAARLCLALCATPSWKSALQQYRIWKANVRALVERHWFAITGLAEELQRRGDLNRADLAGILSHSIRPA